jgi:hypothetical protein
MRVGMPDPGRASSLAYASRLADLTLSVLDVDDPASDPSGPRRLQNAIDQLLRELHSQTCRRYCRRPKPAIEAL